MAVIGERFAGRYLLQELLIEARIGAAFRAHDQDVDETVALLMLDDAAVAAGDAEILRREVRLGRRVTHRNVGRSYDIGEHEGRHYVTFEYVDGVRLPEWLAGEPTSARRREVARQLAAGLAAAHGADVFHGALAPFSVLVDRGDRAVIGNFGHDGREAVQRTAAHTRDLRDLLQSEAYLDPEQAEDRPATPAGDIYGLGLLWWELWTGEPRFVGGPQPGRRSCLDDDLGDLIDPARRELRIPPDFAPLIAACLARDPTERPDAATLLATLSPEQTSTRVEPVTLRADDVATEEREEDLLGPTLLPGQLEAGTVVGLAVLPFRYRGPEQSQYLSEALHDELVDLLARTRGLRVAATGATASSTETGDRDPKSIGERLGVDVIVDGTITLAADRRLRIAARLLEADSGFQLWHERFEGSFADLFELQDKLGKRIAEALRLELDILVEREHLDAEVVEAYLRGRQAHLRWQTHGGNGAVAHYQAALALAPNFKPALAHLAMATLLAWFQPRHEDGRDWARESAQAVAAARARAPELPETQLAIANLAAQQGDFREAMRGVIEALRLAPTFALAHEFIGRLLLEIGREREAQRHLELAMELDPALIYGHADIARVRALHGDLDGFHRHMAVLLRLRDEHVPSLGMNHLRVGAWLRDEAMVRRALDMLDEDNPRMAALRTYGELLLSAGEEPAKSLALFHRLAANSSPRLQTLVVQLRAERAAYHGRYETALQLLQRAGELVLVDLVWLERCPLFAEIRGEPAYLEVLAVVRSRRDQIEAALAAL